MEFAGYEKIAGWVFFNYNYNQKTALNLPFGFMMFRIFANEDARKEPKAGDAKVDLSYLNLEPRQVLNADFDFDGFNLELFDFSDSDSQADQVTISGSGSEYFFQISDGVFNGTDTSGGSGASLSGLGTNLLTLTDANSDLVSISLDDSTDDPFDVRFEGLQFDGTLSITGSNGTFGAITQNNLSLEISDFDFVADSLTLNSAANDFDQVRGTVTSDISIVDINGIDTLGLESAVGDINAVIGGDVQYEFLLAQNGDLDLDSGGRITDTIASELQVFGDANITAVNDVFLADDVDDQFSVGGNAAFSANAISVNSNGEVNTGTLNFNSPGDVVIFEDGNTNVSLTNTAASLNLVSDGIFSDASNSDIVVSNDAKFSADGINLSRNLTATTVFFDSTDGVTQAASSTIDASDLLLRGQGNFLLIADNDIGGETFAGRLAADITGSLNLTNDHAIEVSRLTCGSTTIVGVNIDQLAGAGGDLNLIVTDDSISQQADAPITVAGDTTIQVGTGSVGLTFGDGNGDTINDNDLNTLVIVDATAAEIVDRNDLTVNSANVADRLQLQAGSVDPGNLTLVGNLNAENQVLLQASNGVSQTGGVITTGELLLGGDTAIESTGVYDLINDNVVDQLAFSIVGTLNFNNVGDFEVTSLSYASTSDRAENETIAESSATDKARLIADGMIGLDTGVSSETVFIVATNGVTQTSGQITSTNLMLSGAGLFQLTSATNDTDNLAADIDGTFDYFDADDVTLAELSCDGITINGLNVTVDATVATNNGDLDQDATAAIVVGGLTTLDVGTGTICLVGADGDADGDNDNDLNTLVIVNAADAEIVDRNDLIVNSANVANRLQLQAGNVDPGDLNLAGNLTVGNQILLQASNGVSQTGGIITTGELLLGGDTAIESTGVYDLINDNVVDQLAFQHYWNLEL